MNTLLQDLRYGVRMLLKTPGLTAMALLALALGIGANTAIFSVVDAVLLRPLPFERPEQLAAVSLLNREQGPNGVPLSVADYLDLLEHGRNLEIAAYGADFYNLTRVGADAEQIRGSGVTAGFFATLGAQPLIGRAFMEGEDKPGSEPVVIISHRFWQERFNRDPQALGQQLTLNDRNYTIVGVMPAAFRFPERNSELWTCFQFEPPTRRGPFFLRVIARVKPGGDFDRARAELEQTARRVQLARPELAAKEYGYVTVQLQEQLLGKARPALLVMLGAVVLVLLIASLNVANLLLARAVAREREISIRAALGATRGRIARQLLAEGILLALIGGALGLVVAIWGLDVLLAVSPADIPRLHEVRVNPSVLGWTLLISLGSGLLAGLAPALQSSRPDLNDSLKQSGRAASESGARRRLRNVLVVSEIALALMLLISAGLLIKSFVRLQQVDPGFHSEQVLTMEVPLQRARYPEPPQAIAFQRQLLERLRAMPGVRSAAVASSLPPDDLGWRDHYAVEGQPPLPDAQLPTAPTLIVSPQYFQSLGISIMKGRDFTEAEHREMPPVAIVSETLARHSFPNGDAVGKHVRIGGVDRPGNPWMQIVGIVADVKYSGLAGKSEPVVYQSALQRSYRGMYLVINFTGDVAGLTNAVRREVRTLDAQVPVANVRTIERIMSEAVAQPRFRTMLIGSFAAVALLLAAIGIYGVMAYSVTQRTQEIGIRMALGAQTRDVLKLVVRQGLTLTLIGIAAGLLGAFAATRLIASLLFDVLPYDLTTFATISALLAIVALLACFVPARRAAKVNPIVALNRT